jgi:transposase
MPTTSIVGLDTAKNVFQVHGVDSNGRGSLRKRLRRAQLTDFFANLPACVIGLEATRGRIIGHACWPRSATRCAW